MRAYSTLSWLIIKLTDKFYLSQKRWVRLISAVLWPILHPIYRMAFHLRERGIPKLILRLEFLILLTICIAVVITNAKSIETLLFLWVLGIALKEFNSGLFWIKQRRPAFEDLDIIIYMLEGIIYPLFLGFLINQFRI